MNLGYIEELLFFLTRNFILNRVVPHAAMFVDVVAFATRNLQTCGQTCHQPRAPLLQMARYDGQRFNAWNPSQPGNGSVNDPSSGRTMQPKQSYDRILGEGF